MISPGIQAVAFDAVGTLIHPEPSAPRAYAAVGARFGSRYTPEEIAGRFRAAFQRQEEQDRADGWRTSETREERRWRDIVGEVLDDVSDPGACFAELYEHFSLPGSWAYDPEAPALLDRLASEGYGLALASNYDRRLHRVLAGLPVLGRIGSVVISSEVGWRKPARAFFAAVCRTAGQPPEWVLYVGDDPGNDYVGARAAGLAAVLLDPRRETKAPVRAVARLYELLTSLPPRSPAL